MAEMQMATTEGFLALMADSRYENRNRGPIDELAGQLDPEGTHLLVFKFIHNDVEWRCQWFVKVKDSPTPLPILMDNGFEALEAHTFTRPFEGREET